MCSGGCSVSFGGGGGNKVSVVKSSTSGIAGELPLKGGGSYPANLWGGLRSVGSAALDVNNATPSKDYAKQW